MPVIGIPIPPPSSDGPACSGLGIVRPRLAVVEGQQVLSRLQGISVQQGQSAIVEFILRTEAGDAIDLTSCDFPGDDTESSSSDADDSYIKVALREALSFNDVSTPSVVVPGTTYPPGGTGAIRFQLPVAITAAAGVELAEVGIFDSTGALTYSTLLYVLVNRGQFGPNLQAAGPPTLREIRMRLKASGAEDSYLLDNVEFDDAEIADAIVQTVAWWNESQPPIKQTFNTANYPYPFEAMNGIIGKLYQAVAYYYFREDLTYTVDGVTVADKNKGPTYAKIGEQLWGQYVTWVKRKKASINIDGGFGTIASPYGYAYRWVT